MKVRKHLCACSLFGSIYRVFSKVEEKREFSRNNSVSLVDCIMSALAIFSLKWPSLLAYDRERRSSNIAANLRSLFHISKAPSDTYMRERLDEVDPKTIRGAFKKIWAVMQRGKLLESFRFLEKYYLVSLDGTGVFCSHRIHCQNCCVKAFHDNSKTYYHQMLGAVLVHPNRKEVFPLCPEMIEGQAESSKNDCERSASHRLISDLRREHPHLPMVIVEDALAANAPHIRKLQQYKLNYIIVNKGYCPLDRREDQLVEEMGPNGESHQWRFVNGARLNGANPDVVTNHLEYTLAIPGKKSKTWMWITSLHLTANNVKKISQGGRARWKIENETFNTLKNQGYNFEHNYGHGNKNLCTIMTFLMMLAFLVDQVQLAACTSYQAARKKAGTLYSLWERFRVLFEFAILESWETLLSLVANPKPLNSS